MSDPLAASAPLPWRAYLFGSLRVLRGGVAQRLPTASSARALLAYLLLYPQQAQARAKLLGVFWPEWPENRARHALSQALWQLRQHLPDLVRADAHLVWLEAQPPLWVDTVEFEQLVAPQLRVQSVPAPTVQASLQAALQLAEAELLEGFYDEWVLIKREQLHALRGQALERLTQMAKATGQFDQALQWALALTTADPLREAAQQEVMRLYLSLGRPEAALQHYAAFCRTLKAELGVPPAPETVALADEIARRPLTPGAPLPTPTPVLALGPVPLVGRGLERAQLLQHSEVIFHGAGGMVVLEGEAGVGKTRLVTEVTQELAWRGAQVLWGKGPALDTRPAYGLLVEALTHGLSALRVKQLAQVVEPLWLAVLQPLLPALAGTDAGARPATLIDPLVAELAKERTRLLEAFAQLLQGWTRITPLVLVLDDLHRADDATWDVVRALAHRFAHCPLLLIGTWTDEEPHAQPGLWAKLNPVVQMGRAWRLPLVRLDATTTSELVRYRVTLPPALQQAFETRLYQETGGNPLFVLETLHALHEESWFYQDAGGRWQMRATEVKETVFPLPEAVEHAIRRGLLPLPPEVKELLALAAVLGGPLTLDLLLAVSASQGWEAARTLATLAQLVQRQLLVETDDGYSFSHDKIREVVYRQLEPEACQRLHQQVGLVLEARQPTALETLAHHFTRGAVWAKALHYHTLAGQGAAQVYAYPTALAHFNAGWEILADPARGGAHGTATQLEMLAKRERVLDILGQREAQAADLETMVRLAQGNALQLALVYLRQAERLAHLGRFDEAEHAAQQALALAHERKDTGLQAEALAALSSALRLRGTATQAIPHLQLALTLVGEHEPLLEARLRRGLASALWGLQDYAQALAEGERALALYENLQHKPGQAEVLTLLGGTVALGPHADRARAIQYFERALALAQTLGYRYIEALNSYNVGVVTKEIFQFKAALAPLQKTILISQAVGEVRLEALARLPLAEIYIFLGEYAQATQQIEVALAHARQIGNVIIEGDCLTLLGEIARHAGDWPTALEHLKASAALPRIQNDQVPKYVWLARIALDAGEPIAALQWLDTAEACLRPDVGLDRQIVAQRGRAYLALGQVAEALTLTGRSVADFEPTDFETVVSAPHLVYLARYLALKASGQMRLAHAAIDQAYHWVRKGLAGFGPAEQSQSLAQVPEHREIVAAWQAFQPQQITRQLPRASAPLGRSLRDEDLVAVTWTVQTPEDEAFPDKVTRRHQRLLRLFHEAQAQNAIPRLTDLAEALNVSLALIKLDVSALRQAGHPLAFRRTKTPSA